MAVVPFIGIEYWFALLAIYPSPATIIWKPVESFIHHHFVLSSIASEYRTLSDIKAKFVFQKAEDCRIHWFYPASLPKIADHKEWPPGLRRFSLCSRWTALPEEWKVVSVPLAGTLCTGCCNYSRCPWAQETRNEIRSAAAHFYPMKRKGFLFVPVTLSSAFYKLWCPREEGFHYPV